MLTQRSSPNRSKRSLFGVGCVVLVELFVGRCESNGPGLLTSFLVDWYGSHGELCFGMMLLVVLEWEGMY